MTSHPELPDWTDLDDRAVVYAKALAADAVEKAGNGHPGTAISLAPAAYLLFQRIMRHDPADPVWPGRDRFVLSAGHSSLTLYTQLFYSGYGLELDDLKALRTAGSLTPGHPEHGHTKGVEITTGPLGQGFASAVGMAMAARRERGLFDPDSPDGASPFDHSVYVIAGDGDLQEGVSSEAASLAGTQRLGNLVVLYDDNRISIEDDTQIAFTEDVLARFAAYGWHTQRVDWARPDGYSEDIAALAGAFEAARAERSKPSIIALRTIIGWPAPTKQNSGPIHGSKLGGEEVAGLKRALGLDPAEAFAMPADVLAHVRGVAARGEAAHRAWSERLDIWRAANPERAAMFDRLSTRTLPDGWADAIPTFEPGAMSTRKASGQVISALGAVLPELWGGSADLAESNNTTIAGAPSFLPTDRQTKAWPGDPYGRVLHFGVREHAMGAILNGITLHGPTRVFGGTFLVFSDYMRPAVRLAALMGVPSIFVWSHDSIGLGEDGPTHQPVEHLAALRAIPGLAVVRPADANETAWAWRTILERDAGPAGVILTRQDVPTLDRSGDIAGADGVAKGGYVLKDAPGVPDAILIATGSEVSLALAAQDELAARGVRARVVSMPCLEWFSEQSDEYRESVLPAGVKARVSVEAGVALTWRGLIGDAGEAVSLEHYGASAPGPQLFEEYGFTPSAIADAAARSIAKAVRD